MSSRRSKYTGRIALLQMTVNMNISLICFTSHIFRTKSTRQGCYVLQYFNIVQSCQSREKTHSDLAVGYIECMHKMGGPPQVIMTNGGGALKNSVIFQMFFTEHLIGYIPSRGHPVFAER